MGKHALLSASSSHRWLNCPPSARLSERYEDKGSDYAAQGTDAHTLCEYRLRCALGEDMSQVADIRQTLGYYSDEMEECATEYAAFVMEALSEAHQHCSDPHVLVEQRLDYSRFAENGFGTGDCLIVADGALNVIDFKYGQGVQVEAEQNPQMMLYALGALDLFDDLYDISTVTVTIFQPRRANISTWSVSKADLYAWAEDPSSPPYDHHLDSPSLGAPYWAPNAVTCFLSITMA